MHELGLMEAVLARALDIAAARGATSVSRVGVQVGEFSFASRESLETAFRSLSRGTLLDGAELVLEEIPGFVRCDPCGRSGGLDAVDDPDENGLLLPLCRTCGAPLTILRGRGLTLAELVLNLPDAPDALETDEPMTGS